MIVLKILLILLLVIVGLLLLLLFFPFCYKIHGKSNGTWNLYADVTWLFYFVFLRAHVDLEDKKPKVVLRILGIPITLYPKKEKKQKQKAGDAVSEEPETPEVEKQIKADAPASEDAKIPEEAAGEENSGKDETAGKPKKNFIEKLKKLPEKVSKIRTEILDPHNKAAVKHLLAEAKGIFSHYKPRRIRMHLVFSTGDPATTGKVLGGLSLVPVIYQRGNRIVPDFTADEAYLQGDFKITGHVILIFALAAAVRLIMDKNIRRLIKHVKTLRG